MTIQEVIAKQILWKDKDCSHPQIESLNSYEMNDGESRYVMKTGKFVCYQCGRILSSAEYEQYLSNLNK